MIHFQSAYMSRKLPSRMPFSSIPRDSEWSGALFFFRCPDPSDSPRKLLIMRITALPLRSSSGLTAKLSTQKPLKKSQHLSPGAISFPSRSASTTRANTASRGTPHSMTHCASPEMSRLPSGFTRHTRCMIYWPFGRV